MFFDAGVSVKAPACLPTAEQLLRGYCGRVATITRQVPALVPLVPDVAAIIKGVRFEEVVSILDVYLDLGRQALASLGAPAKPNANHLLLAELGQRGCFLLTTNFDVLVEQAFLTDPRQILRRTCNSGRRMRKSEKPFESSAFAKSLLRRMIRREFATERQHSPFFQHWLDGLHPTLRIVGEQIVREDNVRLHPSAAALNSSMVFGFNLFMPFRFGDARPLGVLLSAAIGREVVVEKVVFEFAGPTAILGEVAGIEPTEEERFTASDVAVFVRDGNGRQGIILIEVKLTEEGFSTCNGAGSRGNRRKDVCDSAERLFNEPDACYLRRPYRASRDRRYWRIFEAAQGSLRAAFPGSATSRECPFRGNSQQLMRNHALLLGVQQAGMVAFGAFALVHHDANPDVVQPWDQYADSVADRSVLLRIAASEIARSVPAPIGPWLDERYLLETR